jgi:hypothetical protein
MKTLFISAGILLVLIGGGIFFFMFIPKNPVPLTPSPVQFPNSDATPNTSSGSSGKTITLAAQGSGKTITAHDFVNNGVTTPNPSNQGNYILTPSNSAAFAITYSSSNQFFTIALQQEPIGQARLDAQTFLLQKLGITQDQLCSLNYYLGTDDQTNSTFAGKNLGFSFCPGAVKLP